MGGDCDDILDPEGKYKGRFRRSVKMLKENGFEVKDVEYPQVGHEFIQEESDEILRFLVDHLLAEPAAPEEASNDGKFLLDEIGSLDQKVDMAHNRAILAAQLIKWRSGPNRLPKDILQGLYGSLVE